MTTLVRPQAIIFDMDGLIFDTETLYRDALLDLAEERKLAAIDAELIASTIGTPWQISRAHFVRVLGGGFDVDGLRRQWLTRFDDLAARRLALKPGVTELLDLLEQEGIRVGVATGSSQAVAIGHLEAHGLLSRFDVLIANEDCLLGKPQPEPFLRAAAALKRDPACCWALEDSANGVRSASAAGMGVIMVPDIIAPSAEIVALCDHVVANLHAMPALLAAAR